MMTLRRVIMWSHYHYTYTCNSITEIQSYDCICGEYKVLQNDIHSPNYNHQFIASKLMGKHWKQSHTDTEYRTACKTVQTQKRQEYHTLLIKAGIVKV